MIDICAACDENYCKHLGALVASVVAQTHEPVRLWLLYTKLSDDAKAKIGSLGAEVRLVEVDSAKFAGLSHNFYTVEVWYRLLMGSLLPRDVERAIYLDCDMVVAGDLTELYNTDLQGNIMGAFHDIKVYKAISDGTGMPVGTPYFNAGMMLVDLRQWRERGVEETLFALARDESKRWLFNDQDVLNFYFHTNGGCLALPKNYNFVLPYKNIRNPWKLHREKRASIAEFERFRGAGKTVILHFIDKPWSTNACYVAWGVRRFYYEALERTPWRFTSKREEQKYLCRQRLKFPFQFLYKAVYGALYAAYCRTLRKLIRR